jgi:hypothetical protein
LKDVRTCLRLAVALSIAVLSSALILAAGAPSRSHDAFACAAPPGAVGDWCHGG